MPLSLNSHARQAYTPRAVAGNAWPYDTKTIAAHRSGYGSVSPSVASTTQAPTTNLLKKTSEWYRSCSRAYTTATDPSLSATICA